MGEATLIPTPPIVAFNRRYRLTEPLASHPATFTVDATEVGNLYYFAPADRAPGPYLKQIHVNAIIDVGSDGTLAGVELIDGMPPPPTAVPHDITRRYEAMLRAHHIYTPVCKPDPGNDLCHVLWMLHQLRKPMETGKAMRWLGFIQGILIERGFTTVTAERDFTRPYFSTRGADV